MGVFEDFQARFDAFATGLAESINAFTMSLEVGHYLRYYQPGPADTVLDVGANIGVFSSSIAPHVARVVAFEPVPSNYDRLVDRVKNIPNVEPMPYAVGNGVGEGVIDDNGPASRVGQGEIPVALTTIDAFSVDTKVAFIKIDVEGSEMEVLEGAALTLRDDRPMVAIEAHGEMLRDECVAFLRGIGYDVAYGQVPSIFTGVSDCYYVWTT